MTLHELVAFDKPHEVEDDYGRTEVSWSEQFCDRVKFRFLRGGEAVQAARLEGRQPVVITLRSHADSRQVTTAWRVRDVRRRTEYNIRSIIEDNDRRHIEITAESGVAV